MIGHVGKGFFTTKTQGVQSFLQSRHWYVYRYLYILIYIYIYIIYIIYNYDMHLHASTVYLYHIIHAPLYAYHMTHALMGVRVDFMADQKPAPPHLHWIKCVRPASALAPHYE